MNISLSPELEAVLNEFALQKGVSPEELALDALRERFVANNGSTKSLDAWEQAVFGIGTDCGVSLPHSALGSEGLHE